MLGADAVEATRPTDTRAAASDVAVVIPPLRRRLAPRRAR
jgi:hypothetical protein